MLAGRPAPRRRPAGRRRARSPTLPVARVVRRRRPWRTSTGRSTTSCPPTLADAAVPGARVQGAVRRPGRRRLRRSSASSEAEHDGAPGAVCAGSSPPSRCSRPRSPGWPGPSPTATPARSPTCCAWPSRRGTPGPRPSAAAPPIRDRGWPTPAARRPGWARYRGGAGVPARRLAAAEPRARSGPRCPGRRWPDAVARRASPRRVAGGRGALVVVPDARDLDRVDGALAAAARRRRPARGC